MTQALQTTSQAGNYYNWLASLVAPHLGQEPLEIGSGLGDHAERWLEDPDIRRLTLTEESAERLALLRQRYKSDERVEVMSWNDAMTSDRTWTSLVGINVIEHVADDVATIRTATARLAPGARVVLFAPAFATLMSDWDREIGHYRRYTRNGATRMAEQAGLRVILCRYVNLPGYFAWLLGMRILRMNSGAGGGKFAQLWDQHVVPRTRRLETRLAPPFGQSVLLVAELPRDQLIG